MSVLKKTIRGSVFLCIMLIIQQCKVYDKPPKTEELATESLADSFNIPEFWETRQDSAEVVENWYKTFNDTHLNELVEEAIDTTNLSIIYQLALIEESIAQVNLAKSDKSVQVGYGGGYTGYSATAAANNYSVGAAGGISWEADLWGKIETGILAADENLKADIYNYSYTRQSIAATTSKLYFQLGTINQSLQIGKEFIDTNKEIKELLKVREDVGISDMKELYLMKAQINSINNIIERYKNELQITTRKLEVVLGRYPENKLIVNWVPQSITPIKEIGQPFELINRRPDLKRDEAIVRSQFFLTEQAELLKYPDLVLSADVGFATIGDLIFGTGASFFGPIFTGGAIESQIQSATAIQKQALMTYGLSILNAFNEVETAMSSETFLLEQEKYIILAIEESKNSYELMLKQYGVGRIGLFEVLQTQMAWLLKELDLIQIRGNLYEQRVQLYLALGGNITKYN